MVGDGGRLPLFLKLVRKLPGGRSYPGDVRGKRKIEVLELVTTGNELPKAMAHFGHGSLIAGTSYGSTEARFDSTGRLMDVTEFAKGGSVRL